MNEPKWNIANGDPESLEAAALDAVEWLLIFDKRSLNEINKKALSRCIEEIKKRVEFPPCRF